MAIFQQSRTNSGVLPETAIGAFVKINGNLSSDGDVRFDGIFENGEMNIKGTLTVGETSQVTATVKADRIVLHGTVIGNVTTESDVEIGATGKLTGDLNAGGNLIIHPGGIFIGKSMMMNAQSKNGVTAEAASAESEEMPEGKKR